MGRAKIYSEKIYREKIYSVKTYSAKVSQRLGIIIFLSLTSLWASGANIEKIDFADTVQQKGQQLILNGVALRTKRKLGINFRVYVAGLYVNVPKFLSCCLLFLAHFRHVHDSSQSIV